jgi:hypothetical protein
MQRYTVFFITVNALHVSDGFSAHHQELETVHTHTQHLVYVKLAARCCVYSSELLMMGGETACNM